MTLKPAWLARFIDVVTWVRSTPTRRHALEISADKVVTIHYTLKDDDGTVIDSSAGAEPLAYIQGHGNLVSGLEKALEGKADGSKVAVSVSPEDGYGKHEPGLIQRVPKRTLQGSGEVKKGMQFQARTEDGMRLFTVTGVPAAIITKWPVFEAATKI